MKTVYRIILAVLGLLSILLCYAGVRLGLKIIRQGQLNSGNKHRVTAMITCAQPVAMLLVAIIITLALRREFKAGRPPL